jgi:molecular chaperone DnaK
MLEDAFGAEIHEDVDPDLAVGLGAALQAGLLRGAAVERILVDVAAHTLGVRVVGHEDTLDEEPDTFAPVLKRNTVLPGQRTEEFYTMYDGQERIEVEVFQGETRRCSQNTRVGSFFFDLEDVPARSPVRFQFNYDLNGIIRVEVSQPGKNNAKTVALKVADAGKKAQAARGKGAKPKAAAPDLERPESPVARKARALLAKLGAGDRNKMQALLAKLESASDDEARAAIEDELLDLFLDHDEGGEDDLDPEPT